MNSNLSIVVGFRNWGLDRILLSISSIRDSLATVSHEIIVSDFGSDNPAQNKTEIEAAGARYVFTDSSRWSRAGALNAGIAASKAEYVMCTDADMLFGPESLKIAFESLRSRPNNIVLIQCRDLPRQWDACRIREVGPQWDEFQVDSMLRPRWGMGGLIGFSRNNFDAIRGFDERMHTYGGEDLDFAQRMQRAGSGVLWLEDPSVRMYHIWHPSSRDAAQLDDKATKAVKQNTKIVEKDPTIIRNLTGDYCFKPRQPLVSVVISTYNRADLIAESISSVLAQSFKDFELIIVDDGSTDNTRDVINSFDDSRIRYIYQENSGISKARNTGTDAALGKYIAVHDDDDLMLPDRLVHSLKAIRAGIRATFGSWVNFSDREGDLFLNVSKKNFTPEVVWGIGPAPGHATWLVETSLMKEVRYDESLTSAVDHNLATRLAMSGVKWAHCGSVLYLRRKHSKQISETDEKRQSGAADLTRNWTAATRGTDSRNQMLARGVGEPWPKLKEKDQLESYCLPWLSDRLVSRTVTVYGTLEAIVDRLEASRRVVGRVISTKVATRETREVVILHEVSWRDLAILRSSGLEYQVEAVRRREDARSGVNEQRILDRALESFVLMLTTCSNVSDGVWLVCGSGEGLDEAPAAEYEGFLEGGRRTKLHIRAWIFQTGKEAKQFERSMSQRGKNTLWVLEL